MLFHRRILGPLAVLVLIVIAGLSSMEAISYLAKAAQGPVPAGTLCGNTAAISNVTVTDVTSMTATISWQTSPATESCLDLDSAIHPAFPNSQPISQTLQGVIYVPGEYARHLDWVDRDLVTGTIASDVEAIASANFNAIVLYPTEPASPTIHPWDQVALNAAAAQGLKTALRLEWYDRPSFDWEPKDCDAILDHYDAYLSYFRANPDRLLYLLINMPLDDPSILEPNLTIGEQRDYICYCYDALKARVPEAAVYANTYYGWQDELHQAPVGDLVDGVAVVIYAQHADGAPFNCNIIPTAGHPASTLICKDQFDYYLDKAWAENNLETLDKPLVLDQTGFAPAASYDDPGQRNGIVADSWAKVRAIEVARRYLEGDVRVYGWSYFKLLHSNEADWGLIDRRRIIDPTITTTHQLTLTNLFPATAYTFTIQAGDTTSGVYTFTTSAVPTQTNVSPLMTITRPPYGHELVASGGQLTITWQDEDPDDNATIGLYYDRDDTGCDGTIIVDGLSEDSPTDIYTWTLPAALPTGSYYIYGQITDGANPMECDYSSGRFVPSTETLEVVPVRDAITVDGVMSEPIWRDAIPLTYATHISQTDVTTATVRAFWDRDYLYVGFAVNDTQVETANVDWDDDSVSIIFNNGEFRCRQDVGGTGEGECDRTLHLPDCTTLDDPGNADCGYTVEMRIHWPKARITANAGDVLPIDFLSVDHDNGPGQPACSPPGPGCRFSKISWDGDSRVDTTGRSITLLRRYGQCKLGHMPAYRPDVDWDGDVDITDVMTVADAWRVERGEPQYRQYYDLCHDERIDIVDIMLVASHWSETVDIGPHLPLCYSPYRPGQAPGGLPPSPLEIGEDMEIIERETKLIRTYGACDEELAIIPDIANYHDIHVYQGVELTSTPSLNDREMDCFAALVAQHQNIVAGVIGNETLLFDRLSESALVDYIEQAKEVGNVPVTTGEPWGVWCNEAQTKPRCQGRALLGEAADFILAYSYPYWESVPIEHGAAHVVATYITLRGVYPDRVVVIGETGWPTCGDSRDNAVPSLENQRRFIEELWRWSNLYNIPIMDFETFDEDWKAAEEGEVGRCWGLYYADRTPKHGNLDWSIPIPEPTPTTPSVRIEHPRDIATTVTKPNCAIPIFGRAYGAGGGWHVKVEVFTNDWYVQDKWYPDGLAPIVDDMWSVPEVFLAGQGGFNNHRIRVTLVDETGVPVASDEVTGIVRANSCSP